jgi:hypothetical protein
VSRFFSVRWIASVLCCLSLGYGGCAHKIHVAPSPPVVAETPIPYSVQVIVPFLALEGADHMPGIALLQWPAKDLRTAAIGYIQQRRTFVSAGDSPSDLALTMKAWLTMLSRGEYRYILRLETDLNPAGKPALKSYVVQKEAVGSSVRWVTASDQGPIAQVVQAAFDDLLAQIEADHALYRTSKSGEGKN